MENQNEVFLKIIKYLKDSSLHFIHLRFYMIISNQRKMALVLGNGMFTVGILSIEIDIKIENKEVIAVVKKEIQNHFDYFINFNLNINFNREYPSCEHTIAQNKCHLSLI